MHIPFLSFKRQWNAIRSSVMPRIEDVLERQAYIGGSSVETFEQALAEYTDADNAVACNSGTDALWLALKALDLKRDMLVLTTPFSFIASSSEIAAHGGIPLFIDSDTATFNIDPTLMEQWLEREAIVRDGKTYHRETNLPVAGIVAVNIFGQCADFTHLRAIAKKWHLWIVEDAAQSIGARWQSIPSGALGDIATFSFYPTKNLGACGDAGAVATTNNALAEAVRKLRNHGRATHYAYEMLGINSRMDAIQAEVLTEKLTHLDAWTRRRQEIAALYTTALSRVPFVTTPYIAGGATHVYHQYGILVDASHRDTLATHLDERGVGSRVFYPESLQSIHFLNADARFNTNCPVATQTTQRILCLPIWPELTNEEVAHVCESIASFVPQSVTHHHENTASL